MSIVDEAKLAELTMFVPGDARGLAERLRLKLSPAHWRSCPYSNCRRCVRASDCPAWRGRPLKPLAAKLLAIGMAKTMAGR